MNANSSKIVLECLSDRKPRAAVEIAEKTGLNYNQVRGALVRLAAKKLVLRSEKYLTSVSVNHHGPKRLVTQNLRWYYLWKINDGVQFVDGVKFVEYRGDPRGNKESVAKKILRFLKEHKNEAFFSSELAEALGVKASHIMSNVRRLEKKGLLLVRGYMRGNRETPFQRGFLISYIDENEERDKAVKKAFDNTEKRISEIDDVQSLQNIRRIRDIIIVNTSRKKLTSLDYLESSLRIKRSSLKYLVSKLLQLYTDIQKVTIFNNFVYLYHISLNTDDLVKLIESEKQYIRTFSGQKARIGHNWEAVVEWFIERFSSGIQFWEQKHRTPNTDPRRITVFLVKPISTNRSRAEFDRVWTARANPFVEPTTYVLECKFKIVRKSDIDLFFEKLRWSKEFGTYSDTGERVIRQGVIGLFAASAFNPADRVVLPTGDVTLPQYAVMRGIQLISAADLNKKLQVKGVDKKITVQKIARYCRNETEVREVLDKIWSNPKAAESILKEVLTKNEDIFNFEKMLEEKDQK